MSLIFIRLCELLHEKNCLLGFPTRSYENLAVKPKKMVRLRLQILNSGSTLRNCYCTIYVAKTKVLLISCMATAQLICLLVFAYAKSKFSHGVVHVVHMLNIYM